MVDVKQQDASGDEHLAMMRASLDRTLAFAEWVNQVPPPAEPQTSAMTVNQMLSKIVGELARIAACFDLKQASEQFQDSSVLVGTDNEQARKMYEEGQKKLREAMARLGCPPMT